MLEGLTPSARSLLASTLAASTNRSYSAAERAYQTWCDDNGITVEIAAATPQRAANWLAHLGTTGKLKAATLGTYRHALKQRWELATQRPQADNPFDATVVCNVLAGLRRRLAQRDLAAREASLARPTTLMPEMLKRAKPHLRVGPDGPMLWAAATMAWNAALRPGEFLGDTAGRDRWIKPSWIQFHADVTATAPIALSSPQPPLSYTLRLRDTKTDQNGTNKPVILAWRPAVRAMWSWLRTRGAEESNIFRTAAGKNLTRGSFIPLIQRAMDAAGVDIKMIGKSFRRGLAARCVSADVAPELVMAQGRWKQFATVRRYAGRQAIAEGAAVAAARVGNAAKKK